MKKTEGRSQIWGVGGNRMRIYVTPCLIILQVIISKSLLNYKKQET